MVEKRKRRNIQCFSSVCKLSLYGCSGVSGKVIEIIRKMNKLECLDLGHSDVDNEGIEELEGLEG